MAALRIADSVGRVLGDRYRLTRPLGTGASAHVYVADDVTLRRRVAIKVLHPGLADDEAFLRRFRAEARAVAALRHPNILRVYDWGEDEGSPYLVTELLEGGSLRALLDRGYLLTPSQATAVGLGAAQALEHAHRRGLVHRDIKPANLLFDDEGRVSVADFGLARALAESTVTEPAGAVVGTARYAAPEQVRGRALDARADVYSLALVLVEATTGTVPFAADTILATLMGRLQEPLRIPDGSPLASVVELAGTIDPADRLDAAGMVRALDALARTLPPPALLPLAGPLSTGEVEHDRNPTELRGGPPDPRRARRAPASQSVLIERSIDLTAAPMTAPADERDRDGDATRLRGISIDEDGDEGPSAAGPNAAGSSAAGPNAGGSSAAGPSVAGPNAAGPSAAGSSAAGSSAAGPNAAGPSAAGPNAAGSSAAGPSLMSARANGDADVPFPDGDAPAAEPRSGRSARLDEGGDTGAAPRRRSRWRVVLAVVVVVLLIAGGAVAWRLTHEPTPIVTVPSVQGQTEAQARATLARRHLLLTVAGRVHEAAAPAGTVASQTPADGRLREHRAVTVIISLGPQPIRIPARLVGLSQAAVTELIEAVGLKPGAVSRTTSLSVPTGDVIATHPGRGTLLPGQAVALLISVGKPHVPVPELIGTSSDSYAAAAAALSAAHLVPSEQLEYSNTIPAGHVIATAPTPKASVLYGSGVQVVVSRGPHMVTVPSVATETVANADQALAADGFVVTGVTGNPGGKVVSTVPPLGESVLYGSDIQLVTG